LNQLVCLSGAGESRASRRSSAAWNVEPVPNSADRQLVVQFNQPQKDLFTIQVQLQTPLGAFPQTADVMQLRPEGATRFAGYFRLVNEGAVRLEVVQASGLSQISPEQFPESDVTKAVFRASGAQRFAYRFSGGDFALRIQADQILPELAVSEVLVYHVGENELVIDTEIELDIREARANCCYAFLKATPWRVRRRGSGVTFSANRSAGQVRLVFGQPWRRQVINWSPRTRLWRASYRCRSSVSQAKSVRGTWPSPPTRVRLTPERPGLTEIARVFRAKCRASGGVRLSDPAWQLRCASSGCLRPCRLTHSTCSPLGRESLTAAA
jgi:hypothetical protein